MSISRVAFVCTGNICRSPMAVAIARSLLQERGLDAEVFSAGTFGIEDHPAAADAIDVLSEIGIDLTPHRSRGIVPNLLRGCDIVVVLAPEHEAVIRTYFPDLTARIDRLWEYTDRPGRLTEIADPYGGERSEFVRCRDELLECVRNWIEVAFGAS
ncbi:MAG: low molecular weight protein arginine phosphatase [Planctomycetota bacterium]